VARAATAGVFLCVCATAQVRVTGVVTDENSAPVAGARVTLTGKQTPAPLSAVSGAKGEFSLQVPSTGPYQVAVDHEGYFRLEHQTVEVFDNPAGLTLVLNRMRELFQSVNVAAGMTGIDPDRTAREKRISGNDILAVPYPTTNSLRNAMRIIPGVLQDRRGGLHVEGAAEDQVLYTLDGFNIGDPLTGRFESRLSVEAVRSVEVSTGRYSSEFGKGSGGAVAVKSVMGDDKFRYFGTNFFPGIENRKGLIIGNLTPRLGITGPIRRGRAWFSDSFDLQYDKTVIEELPKGADRNTSWRFSNMLRTQVNLTPSNILHAGLLGNTSNAARTGLGVLDPPESTIDKRSRQWFFHLRDQVYFQRGALLEVGYAANRTFGREIPQGHEILRLTPEGKHGNHFVDAVRLGGRDQAIANVFWPAFEVVGQHRLKAGLDLDRVTYSQDVVRTGFDHYRDNGVLVRRVVFGGNARFGKSNFESAAYLHDSWKVRPTVLFDIGVRVDRDTLVPRNSLSPRFGFGWSPWGSEKTRLSGGFAIVHDASSLRLFTRPQDQYTLTTYFDDQGLPARGPAVAMYWLDPARRYARPRYESLSLGVERVLPGELLARFDWLRKRGRAGFTYGTGVWAEEPVPPEFQSRFGFPLFDAVYELGNWRSDRFDSASITVRRFFGSQYQWMGSYTRSRAMSNAVVDVNIDDPLIVSQNVGPMPWDAPNRFMSWGYLPTIWKSWAAAYMLEYRTGFPFSVQDDSGKLLGDLNSYRFPDYFELNLHFERRFVFRGFRWAFRFGCNNLTGRRNPSTVNANTASANFMTYYGGQGRTLNFRIRWLGRAR
jgi:hypothetical protein